MSENIITPTEAKIRMATALWEAIRRLPTDVELNVCSLLVLQEFEAGHLNEVRLAFDMDGYASPCGVRISLQEEDLDFCGDWATEDMTPYIWHVALDCVVVGPDFLLNAQGLSFGDLQTPWAVAQAVRAAIKAMPHIAEGAEIEEAKESKA